MKRALILFVAASALSIVACGSDDAPTTATPTDSGTDSTASTLYDRLGKNAGLKSAMDAIVADELKDPEIAAFFAPNLNPAGPPAGRPNGAQIKGCLVEQIANASHDTTKGDTAMPYPTKLADGFQCRDMKTSHAGLGVTESAFNKFGAIAAAVAKGAGLAEADLTSLTNFLAVNKAAIVSAPVTDGGTDSAVVDSGTDAPADAADSG